MKSTVEQLKEKEQAIRKEIFAHQEAREKYLLPIYRKEFIGQCFKCKNSYGSNRPKWWLYIKIIDVSSVNFYNEEEPVFSTLRVQHCSDNRVEIDTNEHNYIRKGDDNIPITAKEFDKAMAEVIKTVHKLIKGANDA